jgi:NAD(P)-dependent dehydrogenase (short-subunit alcohol dehydrogenase family)
MRLLSSASSIHRPGWPTSSRASQLIPPIGWTSCCHGIGRLRHQRSKAAIHSYTQSLRFQLEGSGVEVVEIMPPAIRTEMTADLPDGAGITLISTDKLVKLTLAALEKGILEIHPGQAAQLAFLRRVAPNFINRQLWKAAKPFVPAAADC